MAAKLDRASYLTANTGNFPTEIIMDGRKFVKASDLRYGTNPHQSAAFYRPEGQKGAIMDMVTLKTGKNGLSQTNLEDISGALNIVKYANDNYRFFNGGSREDKNDILSDFSNR